MRATPGSRGSTPLRGEEAVEDEEEEEEEVDTSMISVDVDDNLNRRNYSKNDNRSRVSVNESDLEFETQSDAGKSNNNISIGRNNARQKSNDSVTTDSSDNTNNEKKKTKKKKSLKLNDIVEVAGYDYTGVIIACNDNGTFNIKMPNDKPLIKKFIDAEKITRSQQQTAGEVVHRVMEERRRVRGGDKGADNLMVCLCMPLLVCGPCLMNVGYVACCCPSFFRTMSNTCEVSVCFGAITLPHSWRAKGDSYEVLDYGEVRCTCMGPVMTWKKPVVSSNVAGKRSNVM